MLGRQVTAALRRPLHARLRTTAAPQTPFDLAIRTFTHCPTLLDTAGRPRKAVGEPSRPVKRAVKKAAKKPATPEDLALLAEKKRIAKEKLAAAKQKQKKLDAAGKKKAMAAARDAAMTPEQVERKRASLLRAEVNGLKKAALKPPFPPTVSAWTAFMREKGKDLKASFDPSTKTPQAEIESKLAEHVKNVSAAYKELSAGELEHYNHIARVAKEESIAEFKRWIESHTVQEIKLANTARRALRKREDLKLSPSVTRLIEDHRKPKMPLTAWVLFSTSRQTSDDFRNIAATERMKLIAQEWKALSADEKEKYQKLSEQDKERYESEKSAAVA